MLSRQTLVLTDLFYILLKGFSTLVWLSKVGGPRAPRDVVLKDVISVKALAAVKASVGSKARQQSQISEIRTVNNLHKSVKKFY